MSSSVASKLAAGKHHKKPSDAVTSNSYQSPSTNLHSAILDLQSSTGNRAVSQVLGSEGTHQASDLVPARIRNPVEKRFNEDLSHVRMHTGHLAEDMAKEQNAAAYASGHNIYLSAEIDVESEIGRRVLVHELAHVVQQHRYEPSGLTASHNTLEHEANTVSGMAGAAGPCEAGAATPLSPQKVTDEELDAERKRASVGFRTVESDEVKQLRTKWGLRLPSVSKKAAELTTDPAYIDQHVYAVGYSIWLFGYLLYLKGEELPLFVPQSLVNLSVTNTSSVNTIVYSDYDTAKAAIPHGPLREDQALPYTYFKTAGGKSPLISPTIFCPATTPKIAELMKGAGIAYTNYVLQELEGQATSILTGMVLRGAVRRAPAFGSRLGSIGKKPSGIGITRNTTDVQEGLGKSASPIGEVGDPLLNKQQSANRGTLTNSDRAPLAKNAPAQDDLLNKPPPNARGGPSTPEQEQVAQKLLRRTPGEASPGPAEVYRWSGKVNKSSVKVLRSGVNGEPIEIEITGRGVNGEQITVRSIKGEKGGGTVVKMEIDDLNALPRMAQDKDFNRAMKLAGMANWKEDLSHIQPLFAKGQNVPYNAESGPKWWNRGEKGKTSRRTAESKLETFLKSQPEGAKLKLEITRDLNINNKVLGERFTVRDAKGKTVFDVEVRKRGKVRFTDYLESE